MADLRLAFNSEETIDDVADKLRKLKSMLDSADPFAKDIIIDFLDEAIEEVSNYKEGDTHHYHMLSVKAAEEYYDSRE